MCFSPQRRAFFSTSELTKVLRTRHVLYIFTSKCAFRHSGVHFFDIWTYKSAPNTSCFVHFHFKMCFSPRRAFFRHLNLQKCSEHVMLCTFSLPTVLFATAACNFWFLRWAPTSATRRFNRPTFRLTRHTNHWKNTAFRDFSNIWRGCIFFLLTFALLHLLSADLTTLLCFSTVHIVGSFYLNFLRSLHSTLNKHTNTSWFNMIPYFVANHFQTLPRRGSPSKSSENRGDGLTITIKKSSSKCHPKSFISIFSYGLSGLCMWTYQKCFSSHGVSWFTSRVWSGILMFSSLIQWNCYSIPFLFTKLKWDMHEKKKPSYFPFYWLFNRDPG